MAVRLVRSGQGSGPQRQAPGPNATSRRKDRPNAIKAPVATENQLHRAVAEFLDLVLLSPAVWTTFPAGWGKLSKATAGYLKSCGLKEGIPDVLIFDPNVGCLGIELKRPGKKRTKVQVEMHGRLADAGVIVETATSVEDVARIIRRERLPLRGFYIQQYPRPSDAVMDILTDGEMAH